METQRSSLVIDYSHVPTDRNLPNEARLLRRLEERVSQTIDGILAARGVTDLAAGGPVSIKVTLNEPILRFNRSSGQAVLSVVGNNRYRVGDIIPKPPGGMSSGGGAGAGLGDEDEDQFTFYIDAEEMNRRILEGLKLPNMQDKTILRHEIATLEKAGFQPDGSPANLDLVRSSVKATGRRLAHRRPKRSDMRAIQSDIDELEALEVLDGAGSRRLSELYARMVQCKAKRRSSPFIDPSDLRYRRTELVPQPISQAVMFALMDVSGSMTEQLKDLAKRFFWLLRKFLEREYRTVTMVFIRHTDTAQEVSEHEFFFDKRTGGTVVSSALEKVDEVIRNRFPLDQYNIYCCQAGDGDTWLNHQGQDDALISAMYLQTHLLPILQYFAYLECREKGSLSPKKGAAAETPLWSAYGQMLKSRHFQMRRVDDKGQIFPVFQQLFRDDDSRRKVKLVT